MIRIIRAALIVLLVSASFPVTAGDGKPSVLIYTRGPSQIDYAYMKYLYQREGFHVDYTGHTKPSHVPLTWDLMKNYNCIVVLAPGNSRNTQWKGIQCKDTAAALDKFMEAGGGVLLAPAFLHWDYEEVYINWEPSYGKMFGAWFLRRHILWEENKDNIAIAGFFYGRYQYTKNVIPHVVTKGVSGVWIPTFPKDKKKDSGFDNREIGTYPLSLSKDWTVVLRASKTTSTIPGCNALQHLNVPVLDSKEPIKSEPPIFGVREYKKGRMAFFAMNGTNHFISGIHHNKGGDIDELKGGYVLEAGCKGKPSHFSRLITNTIRWLSEPSLESGAVGGYTQDMSKFEELSPGKPGASPDWQNKYYKDWHKAIHPTFRGLIGARTSLSTGKGSVKQYKKAAKEAGLDFVVFLETFEKMSPEKLETLKESCKKESDKDIQLIPGMYFKDNRGHHQYYYGVNKLAWPSKEYLTEDGKRFDLSTRPKGGLPHITFMCNNASNKNSLGYFALPSSPITRMWNLKLYASVGLFHYRKGKLVDGMKENFYEYREVNNAGCNIFPKSIDLVSSPAELKKAVKDGHMLTCVKVKQVEAVASALKYNYNRAPNVFVSNGPDIVAWDQFNTRYGTYSVSYITPNYRWPVRIHLKSDVGLKEVKIWDGVEPFMRIELNGEKEFRRILELNHNTEKNLILEIRDVEGNLAVSSEAWDDNGMCLHYWCGDRVNGQLKHGPLYFFGTYGEQGINFVSKGQDSFALYARPLGLNYKNFISSEAEFTIGRLANRPLENMVSEDGGLFTNLCSMYFPESEKCGNVWMTYGPLHDTKLFDLHQTHLMFRNHYVRPNPYNPTIWGISGRGDIRLGLNINKFIFKKEQTLKSLPYRGYRYNYTQLPGCKMVLAVCRNGQSHPISGIYSRDREDLKRWKKILNDPKDPFRVEYGGFFALYGTKPGAATIIQYNVGNTPLVFEPVGDLWVYADVKGKQVKKGDVIEIKTLGIAGEVPKETGAWRYQQIADYIGLDGKPDYKLKLTRGKQLPVTDGFCDLEAKNGAIEFELPNPKVGLQLVLAMRINGMNDLWSAVCYDKALNQARPIAVYKGTGYARFDPEYADVTKAIVGHPIIADNKDLVIIFTILGDEKYPYNKEKTWAFSLQVNNPTDSPVTTTLKKGFDLPGLDFPDKNITIPAGGFIDVIKET